MSQITGLIRVFAACCALLTALAIGCSKKNGVPFDPDAAHPSDYITTHPAFYRGTGEACADCHGGDLLGGISTVSCFSISRDGQACHPGGPAGHPAGWRSSHATTNPAQAVTCAVCHDNAANNLPPGCFNNSLCHGARSTHPAGWRTTHQGTQPGEASACAACHPDKGTPSCFTSTACHGSGSGHPLGWVDGSKHGRTAEAAPGNASGMASCSTCHGTTFGGGTGPSCLTCHGGNAPHPKSNWTGESGRHRNADTGNTAACARCHTQLAGSPNCRNTNGCHGGD